MGRTASPKGAVRKGAQRLLRAKPVTRIATHQDWREAPYQTPRHSLRRLFMLGGAMHGKNCQPQGRGSQRSAATATGEARHPHSDSSGVAGSALPNPKAQSASSFFAWWSYAWEELPARRARFARSAATLRPKSENRPLKDLLKSYQTAHRVSCSYNPSDSCRDFPKRMRIHADEERIKSRG